MRKAQRHRLSDLVTFVSGGTPSKQERAFWGGETPWVSAKDLKSLRISHSIDTLSQAGRQKSSLVPPGTLLVLVRGMSLFKKIPLGVSMRELAINQDIKGLVPKESVSPFFLAYSLLSMETELLQMVEAAGHGTGRLDTDSLKDLPVWIPERKMQDSIVDILSTWDAAIEKIEQLIAEKERILNFLMQRLVLQDHHPVFPLSNLANRVTRKNTIGNNHPLTISGRDGLISQHSFFDKRIAAQSTENYTLIKKGEFAYNKSHSAGYPQGAIKRLDAIEEGIVSSLYICFQINPEAPVLSDYFLYFCEAGGFNSQIGGMAQEGARNHGLLNVSIENFFSMAMPVPSIEHQTEIIGILNFASREISLLKARLQKIRLQKRGLMQKLLTGRWRLPADLPEAPR